MGRDAKLTISSVGPSTGSGRAPSTLRQAQGKRRVRAAVVVLEGSRRSDVRRALSWGRRFDPHPTLVAVDGGWTTCRAMGLRPDLFAGDLDSTKSAPPGVESKLFPRAKDFSDAAGALAALRRKKTEVVVVSGLLGGRLDHEWANILEIAATASRFDGILAPSARGLVIVSAYGMRVRTPRRSFSLFALNGRARVTLRGARWPLSRRALKPGSRGLSNISKGEVSLVVHDGVAALVFPA